MFPSLFPFFSNFSGVSARTLNLGFKSGVQVELGGLRVVDAFGIVFRIPATTS